MARFEAVGDAEGAFFAVAAAKVGLRVLHVRMLVSGDRSYLSEYIHSTRFTSWIDCKLQEMSRTDDQDASTSDAGHRSKEKQGFDRT